MILGLTSLILALSSLSTVLSSTEPNKPAVTTKDMLRQFEFDRRMDEEYAGQAYPQNKPAVATEDMFTQFEVDRRRDEAYAGQAYPQNKPAPAVKDVSSRFQVDRRRDERYAGQAYPPRGDVVPYDLYEDEPTISDFGRTIHDLEEDISELNPTLPERDSTASPTVKPVSERNTASPHIISTVGSTSTVTKPVLESTTAQPETSHTEPKPEVLKPTVAHIKTTPNEPDSRSYHSKTFNKWLENQTPNKNATLFWFLKIKSILRRHKLDSHLKNNSFVRATNDSVPPILRSVPGIIPNEDVSGDDVIMADVLPAAIAFLACIVVVTLGTILFCLCRNHASKDLHQSGTLGGADVDMRKTAWGDPRVHEQTPQEKFMSKSNYYIPNIVDQMPENLLNDKTVYVDKKSETIVRVDADRCRSLSPISVHSLEYDSFYSQLSCDETAKTPAGLGEDADGQCFSSDSKLRFVSIPLDVEENKDTPIGGVSVVRVTHVTDI